MCVVVASVCDERVLLQTVRFSIIMCMSSSFGLSGDPECMYVALYLCISVVFSTGNEGVFLALAFHAVTMYWVYLCRDTLEGGRRDVQQHVSLGWWASMFSSCRTRRLFSGYTVQDYIVYYIVYCILYIILYCTPCSVQLYDYSPLHDYYYLL